MAFSRDAVQAVKQGADIVQIIGERVALSPSGANFKGLCPFHSEKTPSFMVNPQRGMYHCFGCEAGGSVIDFLMAFERLSFPEAVATLAQRLGIELAPGGPPPPGGKALKLLEHARGFYSENLLRRPEAEAARRYLKGRGFEEAAWTAFRLGFAPEAWQELTGQASGEGFALDDQVASGLVKTGQSGRPYDLLRGRIVFPIHDPRGACVAFGARAILPDAQPKYLNTPETRHYHKSKVLFGLFEGQEALRREREALLVEGYLDVMRLHGAGFQHAVATCGTALTSDHLALLERYVDRVVLLFDGDEAGGKAAQRSASLFLNSGLEARVATLPDGLDPDDLVRRQGPEPLAEAVKNAKPILEFLVWETLRRHGNSLAGKERTLRELLPILAEMKRDTARDVTIRYLADLLEVKPDHIAGMMRPKPAAADRPAEGEALSLTAREQRHQRLFLNILLQHPALVTEAAGLVQPGEFTAPPLRQLYEVLLAMTPEEVAGLAPEALAEQRPEVAAAVRSLLVDTALGFQAVGSFSATLQYEGALIKEANKTRLFQEFKRAAGTEQEEPALRRFVKVRDELRAMKSVPGARNLGSGSGEPPPPPESAAAPAPPPPQPVTAPG